MISGAACQMTAFDLIILLQFVSRSELASLSVELIGGSSPSYIVPNG